MYALVDAILRLLQAEFSGELQQAIVPVSQWYRLPLAQVQESELPRAGVYLGKLAIAPTPADIYSQPLCRDIHQDLWIDLESPQGDHLDQLTALVMASLLLGEPALVAEFNTLAQPTDHTYTAKTVAVRHRLRQLQFVGATPTYDAEPGRLPAGDSLQRSQLQFLAIGQLAMTKLTPDSVAVIQTIKTSGTLQGDPSTQWQTD